MTAFRIFRRLSELLDVTVAAPTDGQVLTYDTGTSKWRNEAAAGGGASVPLVLAGTDPLASVLDIHADDAQTEHIFRAYDVLGDLAVDIDFQGKLDARVLSIQSPPDTGGPAGASSSHVAPDEWVINSGSDTTNPPFKITKWVEALGNTRNRLLIRYEDTEILEFSPIESEVCITIAAPATPTGNAIELWDHPFNNLLFAVGYDGSISVSLPTSNPGPGKLWNNAGTVKVGT